MERNAGSGTAPRDRFEMAAEHLQHPIRIARDLELREVRIIRKSPETNLSS